MNRINNLFKSCLIIILLLKAILLIGRYGFDYQIFKFIISQDLITFTLKQTLR